MLKTQIKLAWRNLIKNKAYLIVNLSGLTVAMTCFILIGLFVEFELGFDKHHQKSHSTYRIVQQQKGNSYQGTDLFAVAPLPLGEALLQDFPEVEHVTNLNTGGALLIKDDVSLVQQGLYTDTNYFDVFTTLVKEGNGKEALEDPNTILLTESLSHKLFGNRSPLEQTLKFGDGKTYTVKAVVEDPPKNQHFTYDFIVSYKGQGYYPNDVGFWVSNNYHTYLTLDEAQSHTDLEKKMAIYEKITKPAYKKQGFEFYPEYKLQPLEDIHLKSDINMELSQNGDIKNVRLFAFIALIIIALAAINYTNLATSKSAQRSREVGVSKVLGAKRGNLIVQYLSESVFLTLTSFLFALLLVTILLPYFNEFLNREISFDIFTNSPILLLLLSIALTIGIIAGLYPAFFLSGMSAVKALKGNFLKDRKEGTLLRNTLVIGQFAVAIGLAIASVIIHQQLQFTQNKKLGYSKEQLLHVRYFEPEITAKQDILKEMLLKHPDIDKVSLSSQLPFNVTSQGPVSSWEGNVNKEQLYIHRTYVDYDFLDVFQMELAQGRNFSPEIASDSSAYLINEAALKALGWQDAIGKTFVDGKVIGVLKDFHLKTFDQAIEPLFMALRTPEFTRNFGEVVVKMAMNEPNETSRFVEETMKSIVPQVPYEARFVNDSYTRFYDEERRLGQIFNLFTILSLFIAGMGLFGMVSFQIVQRSKEISIRKVLGSSAQGIVKLLVKGFIGQILIALVIAIPIAYYFMEEWLQEYVYRISIPWWVGLFIGLFAMVLAFLSVGFQSIKVALRNPVDNLRAE